MRQSVVDCLVRALELLDLSDSARSENDFDN